MSDPDVLIEEQVPDLFISDEKCTDEEFIQPGIIMEDDDGKETDGKETDGKETDGKDEESDDEKGEEIILIPIDLERQVFVRYDERRATMGTDLLKKLRFHVCKIYQDEDYHDEGVLACQIVQALKRKSIELFARTVIDLGYDNHNLNHRDIFEVLYRYLYQLK